MTANQFVIIMLSGMVGLSLLITAVVLFFWWRPDPWEPIYKGNSRSTIEVIGFYNSDKVKFSHSGGYGGSGGSTIGCVIVKKEDEK